MSPDSPVAIGVVAFFDTLPRLLVGAVGGAIADRFDRRRVLMITQTAGDDPGDYLLACGRVRSHPVWHIAALAFFLGVVNTINQTARQSLVNSLVPRDELLNAIGLQSSVFNFSKILGPSVGGVIIAYVGIAGCFLVNAISFRFLLSIFIRWTCRHGKNAAMKKVCGLTSRKDSFIARQSSSTLHRRTSYVVATFVAPYNRFVPIFATNVLHVGASGFGLLMSAPGVGATVAALVLASVNKLRVGVRSICACQLGFALSIGLFAFSHQFLLSFLFLAMVGFCQIAGRALSNTAIQTSTPDNLLGRVLSIFFMDRGLWSLGSMLIGALGAVIGMDWTFALCGAICAITALAVMSISRKYRAEIARRDTERILKTDLGA